MITVLTPTYNRAYIINKAYNSLKKQTSKNFEWIVVDDGSTDNTEKLFNKIIKEKKVDVKYYKKENGGKCDAVNYGVKKSNGDYLIILDSDDTLLPNAIEIIEKYINKYKNEKKCCGFSFLRVYPNMKKIGSVMKEDEIISNHIDYRCNNNMYGDMAEVFKTSILKKYPFPKFFDERFLSEVIIWGKIAIDYNTVYINKPIYVTEYLSDGITNNYIKLVARNPYGAMMVSNQFLNKRYKLIIRIKNAILYNGYKVKAKKKYGEIKHKSENCLLTTILKPAGYLFYLIYLKKYPL